MALSQQSDAPAVIGGLVGIAAGIAFLSVVGAAFPILFFAVAGAGAAAGAAYGAKNDGGLDGALFFGFLGACVGILAVCTPLGGMAAGMYAGDRLTPEKDPGTGETSRPVHPKPREETLARTSSRLSQGLKLVFNLQQGSTAETTAQPARGPSRPMVDGGSRTP